jgi:hypothetical protein
MCASPGAPPPLLRHEAGRRRAPGAPRRPPPARARAARGGAGVGVGRSVTGALVDGGQPALHVPQADEPQAGGGGGLAVVLVLEYPVDWGFAVQGRGGRRSAVFGGGRGVGGGAAAVGARRAARARGPRTDAPRGPTRRGARPARRARAPLSPPLPSLLGVTSLSVPNPALTKALTSVAARFWRAESTAGPWGWRPSARGGRGAGVGRGPGYPRAC